MLNTRFVKFYFHWDKINDSFSHFFLLVLIAHPILYITSCFPRWCWHHHAACLLWTNQLPFSALNHKHVFFCCFSCCVIHFFPDNVQMSLISYMCISRLFVWTFRFLYSSHWTVHRWVNGCDVHLGMLAVIFSVLSVLWLAVLLWCHSFVTMLRCSWSPAGMVLWILCL